MTRYYSSTAQPTTLSSACTDVAVSIQVAATTGFPAAEFILALDYGTAQQELVKVTAVAGTTLTVVRGFDSSTAQAHSLGAAVRHVHSADDFRLSRSHESASSGVHGVTGAVVGTTDTQALSNKDLSAGSNTFPSSLATDAELASHAGTAAGVHGVTGSVVGTSDAQTLTNKSVNLGNNTLTGTTAQFNTALTDNDFATLAGTETLTNKTITSATFLAGALTQLPLIRCTSTTRPAHNAGQAIYETDSGGIFVSDGTNWKSVFAAADLFLGNETAYAGTNPPAGTRKIQKTGTVVVTTAANGSWAYNFPSAFPNGLVSFLAFPDSANGLVTLLTSQGVSGVNGVSGFALASGGSAVASASIRFMYIAVGW